MFSPPPVNDNGEGAAYFFSTQSPVRDSAEYDERRNADDSNSLHSSDS